jgi:hypothetical protein
MDGALAFDVAAECLVSGCVGELGAIPAILVGVLVERRDLERALGLRHPATSVALVNVSGDGELDLGDEIGVMLHHVPAREP